MHMHRHMAAKDGGTQQGCAGCSEGLKAWAGGGGGRGQGVKAE